MSTMKELDFDQQVNCANVVKETEQVNISEAMKICSLFRTFTSSSHSKSHAT